MVDEIKSRKLFYLILTFIILSALFLRVYKVNQLLGFYFDQGRDALVVWDLLHKGKYFLIGPVTGIEGVFLGPFYYYLLAPFYFLGRGDPVYPAAFLSFLSLAGIIFIYYLGFRVRSRVVGFVAAFISAFSYNLIINSRWLANPTPILFTGPLIGICLVNIVENKGRIWWVICSFLIGVSLQFELATAFFYIPSFIIFAFWKRKEIDLKTIGFSIFVFLVTLLPQLVFDFRHDHILFKALRTGMTKNSESVFRPNNYLRSFFRLFSPHETNFLLAYMITAASIFLLKAREIFKSDSVKALCLFLIVPVLGFLFFRNNEGKIYDYYLIGYFSFFIILFSVAVSYLTADNFTKIFFVLFFILFFGENFPLTKNYLSKGIAPFSFSDQKDAANWTLDNSGGKNFNVDVYVPPVIPYAYDYLFLWLGNEKCGQKLCGLVKEKQVPLLYTIYENDESVRLNEWRSRQGKIGRIEKEVNFRGLVVQQRTRI